MIELKDILYKVSLTSTYGDMSIKVKGVCFDSRKVQPGFLFVAVRGTLSDGHTFINKAVESGAVAVVCEIIPDLVSDNATYVTVKNSANALGTIASNFY
jgi:UDP-N-acetylmuramoyl-L-alanyl-D-glutamate--2,6-diaminopimelate ligase